MEYSLTDRAERDVVQIYADGSRLFGGEQADRYHDRLFDVFDLLVGSPLLARERREFDPPVRIHPCGSHVIVYTVEESGNVLILRVRHGHEDWAADPVGD